MIQPRLSATRPRATRWSPEVPSRSIGSPRPPSPCAASPVDGAARRDRLACDRVADPRNARPASRPRGRRAADLRERLLCAWSDTTLCPQLISKISPKRSIGAGIWAVDGGTRGGAMIPESDDPATAERYPSTGHPLVSRGPVAIDRFATPAVVALCRIAPRRCRTKRDRNSMIQPRPSATRPRATRWSPEVPVAIESSSRPPRRHHQDRAAQKILSRPTKQHRYRAWFRPRSAPTWAPQLTSARGCASIDTHSPSPAHRLDTGRTP